MARKPKFTPPKYEVASPDQNNGDPNDVPPSKNSNENGNFASGNDGFNFINWIKVNVIDFHFFFDYLKKYNDEFFFWGKGILMPLFFLFSLIFEITFKFFAGLLILLLLIILIIVFIKGLGVVEYDPKYVGGCILHVAKCT